MPKIEYISAIEEFVLNEDYKGLRQCRIEATVSGEYFPVEVGHIRVWNDDKLFNAVRKAIHGPVEESNDEN